ncbi:MAG: hypothetical protein WBZ36_18080 [Candidatus Nitrosopolaris sp.]
MSVQTDAATQDIEIKYDEFQKCCENILPKVDPKLIEDFLFRERENSDIKPTYSLEVITREGLDTQKMRDLMWDEMGEMPVIDNNGRCYRIEHTLTLGLLKQLSDHDYVLSVKGSYYYA